VHPGRVAASHILDVELRYLGSAPGPLGPRTKVLVHHGTTQVLATLALVGQTELAPGGTGLAQLRIDATTPLGALPGDRFIVRGFTTTPKQGSTIGGGRVVRVLAPKARKGGLHAQTVATLAAARHDQRLALDVRTAAYAGLTIGDLVRRLGVPSATLVEPLAALVAAGELLVTGEGEHAHYLHAQAIAELEGKLATLLAAAPDGLPREALRTQLPPSLSPRAYDAILAGLEARHAITTAGDRVARATSTPRPAVSPVEQKLADQLEKWACEPLRPKEMPAALGLTDAQVKAALDRLVAAKLAVRVKPDLFVHAAVIADLRARLVAFLEAHTTIDAQQWKDLTGASRKFTIPLAEYFDAEKLTLRVGDLRRKR
jgi:selenocysteine-specific elongation factor